MSKKIITSALLLFIGPLFKSKEVPIEEAKVTLNIWGLWERPEVMQSMIQKYQEQNPNVQINYDDRSVFSDFICLVNMWITILRAPAISSLIRRNVSSEIMQVLYQLFYFSFCSLWLWL